MKDSCNNKSIVEPAIPNDFCVFSKHNHIIMTQLEEDGCAEGKLTLHPESLNPLGLVHGGALVALADTVVGWAIGNHTKRKCVTLGTNFQFLRSATMETTQVRCRAIPQKWGRTISVYESKLYDDRDRLLATGVFTFHMGEAFSFEMD